MAPSSLPAPCIVALREPVVLRGSRHIDTATRIELLCQTHLGHEVFYTLDGRKPEPYYAGVLQGGAPLKYRRPFLLRPGKVTVRAIAVLAKVHTVRSSVVTKQFEVFEHPGYRKDRNKKKSKTVVASNRVVEPERIPSPPLSVADPFLDGPESCHSEVEESLPSESENTSTAVPPLLPENEEGARQVATDDAPVVVYPEDEETFILANNGLEVLGNSDDHFPPDLPSRCDRCDTVLQNCPSCDSLNVTTSRHCVHCGFKLAHACPFCHGLNPASSAFCRGCGESMVADGRDQKVECVNSCTMTERTRMCSASVQQNLSFCDKSSQTVPQPRSPKGSNSKKPPPHSPGRGFWHQQLDYICNHLKAYVYNNEEFRRSMSAPVLSEFRSVELLETADNISIVLSFAPLALGEEVDHSL